ncbi:triosephosphate isomerase [Aureococcus anophagefferens]|nr:triosephosphate isomerase [Aureococcus anophagefferens]
MLRVSMVVSLAVLSDAARALIAGNWKCNPASVDDAVALATALHAAAPEREVVVFPPSPYLEPSLGGVTYVLAGHSERRSLFGDDDAAVKDKVRKTLDAGFAPMVCIGETREEYELGITDDVCAVQLCKALTGVTAAELERVVVAYEPVWAIGTGLTCPPKVAQKVHERIRGRLATMYSREAADGCRVLYGAR